MNEWIGQYVAHIAVQREYYWSSTLQTLLHFRRIYRIEFPLQRNEFWSGELGTRRTLNVWKVLSVKCCIKCRTFTNPWINLLSECERLARDIRPQCAVPRGFVCLSSSASRGAGPTEHSTALTVLFLLSRTVNSPLLQPARSENVKSRSCCSPVGRDTESSIKEIN